MSRRDSKNRKLNKGEYQRSDGRYAFRYIDSDGKERWVYSWRLAASDKVPDGKSAGPCLRDMENDIFKSKAEGISSFTAGKITLNQCFSSYMELKGDLKERTKIHYKKQWEKHVAGTIGNKPIGDIRYSDVLRLFSNLIDHDGLSPGSVKNIYILLHPVFSIAVRDGLIRSNTSDGALQAALKNRVGTGRKRRALTKEQQDAFVKFISGCPKYGRWRRLVIFLLGTGCRIGEASGLTWDDCDFENGTISINHQLGYYRAEGDGVYGRHILSPKSSSGNRIIPMFDAVREVLLEERAMQDASEVEGITVDGYKGFIFRTRTGSLLDDGSISSGLKRIVRRYNIIEGKSAEKEGRKAFLLPEFTTHDLRHTFCTRMCENETNLKVIQDVMGHRDISTTMNVYSEATMAAKKSSFRNLEGKII